jgi:hypothetical protein
MSNKNPFEVRLEVLKMAKDMLDQAYNESTQLAWSMVEKSAEYQNKSMSEMQTYLETLKPKMYSPQDIITKAGELYEFVTTKKD